MNHIQPQQLHESIVMLLCVHIDNVMMTQEHAILSGATTLTGSAVVDGTGQIALDNLFCSGTESRLVDCPHSGLNVHNCAHSEDAGVRCLTLITSKNIG